MNTEIRNPFFFPTKPAQARKHADWCSACVDAWNKDSAGEYDLHNTIDDAYRAWHEHKQEDPIATAKKIWRAGRAAD